MLYARRFFAVFTILALLIQLTGCSSGVGDVGDPSPTDGDQAAIDKDAIPIHPVYLFIYNVDENVSQSTADWIVSKFPKSVLKNCTTMSIALGSADIDKDFFVLVTYRPDSEGIYSSEMYGISAGDTSPSLVVIAEAVDDDNGEVFFVDNVGTKTLLIEAEDGIPTVYNADKGFWKKLATGYLMMAASTPICGAIGLVNLGAGLGCSLVYLGIGAMM